MSTSEVSFEQRFGQMVDAELNEKLPTLIDHRAGFQVIDKADDDSKAVGVYAFILNNVWIYLPVFFIDGKLEGFELLYLKQKDVFVPAMDNWVAAINEKGLQVLGGAMSEREDEADGVKASPDNTKTYLGQGTFSKIAADVNAPFGTVSRLAAKMQDDDPNSYLEKSAVLKMFTPYSDKVATLLPDLSRDLPLLHKQAKQRFLNTLVKSPDFANSLFTHYTPDDIEKIAAECLKNNVTPRKPEAIEYITSMNSKEAAGLEPGEKKLLVKNGIFVKDHRTNFSKVYHEEVDTSVLQNISSPGVYDVLMQDGKFEKRIVLVPKVLDDLSSASKVSKYLKTTESMGVDIAVINPAKPKDFERRCSSELYGKPATNCKPSELYDQTGGIKASMRSLRDVPEGAYLLFANGTKEAFVTCLKERRKDASSDIVVTIKGSTAHMTKDPSVNCYPSEMTLHFVEGGKLCIKGDMLFVPKDSRVFVDYPEWMSYCKDINKGPNGGSIAKVTYGTPNVIRDLAFGDSSMGRVQIDSSGDRVSIKDSNGHSDMMTKKAALKVLCEKHGIQASQAMTLIKEASSSKTGRKGWFVKYAAPYDTEAYEGSRMPFMGGPSGRTDEKTKTSETEIKEGAPLTVASDASGASILPEDAINEASRASQAGVREVLDVEVLKQLLDKADISELRKDYIAEMMQGMDRVGRMLFIYYWHHDEFEAKYGKDQIQELKEKMVQVFQSTGDLILFLKEKTAFNPDQSESVFGALSEDVATAG